MTDRRTTWTAIGAVTLALLGFVATDFIVTITLSAADATAHVLENPYMPHALAGQQVPVTLFLVAILGGVFLKGFREAIGIAVGLVAAYLTLNFIVIVVAFRHFLANPHLLTDWKDALFEHHGNPVLMVAVALIVFPRLALGLSGALSGAGWEAQGSTAQEVRDGNDKAANFLTGQVMKLSKGKANPKLVTEAILAKLRG